MKTLDMSKYDPWKKYIEDGQCEEGQGCTGCQYSDECIRFNKILEIELGEDED